jgi:hypothetical protein
MTHFRLLNAMAQSRLVEIAQSQGQPLQGDDHAGGVHTTVIEFSDRLVRIHHQHADVLSFMIQTVYATGMGGIDQSAEQMDTVDRDPRAHHKAADRLQLLDRTIRFLQRLASGYLLR